MKGSTIQHHPGLVEENMSNLTSASGDHASVSSNQQQSSFASAAPNPNNPVKKKRNLPGNPDPEAEVVALSPKSLLATNRFMCEICNKGFQRDQNLQLHRRGHNLPWKLKHRSGKEVRKKVYICPELTCVHHDPSKALGDLTGIKKHYCRKHGEKKWKCDKCSKKYAVRSDWKAHSKTCGTREYRCDCGTLFSRRDSFITHRAFCDALAEESARVISANPVSIISCQQYPFLFSQAPATTSHDLDGGSSGSTPLILPNTATAGNVGLQPKHEQQQQEVGEEEEEEDFSCTGPSWLTNCRGTGSTPTFLQHMDVVVPCSLFSGGASGHEQMLPQGDRNPSSLPPPPPCYLQTSAPPAHMSATALLQRAAQMGATMGTRVPSQMAAAAHASPCTTSASNPIGFGVGLAPPSPEEPGGFTHVSPPPRPPPLGHDHMMMPPTTTSGLTGSFEDTFGSIMFASKGCSSTGIVDTILATNPEESLSNKLAGGGKDDGLTRDFLGLTAAFPNNDILNMAGLDPCMSSSAYKHPQLAKEPWHG